MAITRKPRRAADGPVDVEALINKGGTVAPKTAMNGGGQVTPVILRLPKGILGQIDAAVKSRPIKMPRHTWILEAIVEKLAQRD
jgi:hypothetical protein